MRQIFLGLVLHNHQPVGNSPWVEQVYRDAYLPTVELLEKHPAIRLCLHYSGALLDWFRACRPELIPRIERLTKSGQVEIMTGGYYEPILPVIPEVDRQGQIAKLTAAIRREFDYTATGFWLAERVWEPHLAETLANAEVEWTIVDDTHFRLVGLGDEELLGYYITEENGKPVKVYGSSKCLRYAIPFHDVSEVIGYLRDKATDTSDRIVVVADDGEKFGGWHGTYDQCWKKGWMESFFASLEENSDWLHTIPLGEFARRFPPMGRVYLPTASYDEMLEWALPAHKSRELAKLARELEEQGRQAILKYVGVGFWRHFLVKYPEINTMHKKMMRVHDKVYRARQVDGDDCGLEELWQGQCNCSYWHGLFGGIYMTDIRATTYQKLIQAENKADSLLRPGAGWVAYEQLDFDCDGADEILIESDALGLYLDPGDGGSLFEWDLRRHSYNLASTVSRWEQADHLALSKLKQRGVESSPDAAGAKERRARGRVAHDWYRRACMVDHFLDGRATLGNFARCSYRELGDFVAQPYVGRVERAGDRITALLTRDGWLKSGRRLTPIKVEKELGMAAGGEEVLVRYRLTNLGRDACRALFATEWNINLLGGARNEFAYYEVPGIKLDDRHLDSFGELFDVDELRLVNLWLGIELSLKLSQSTRLWRFPVEAICSSGSGIEKVYQGSCILPVVPLTLAPGASYYLELAWSVV